MRYLVRERLFSITDDFWVTDEQGDQVFYVDAEIPLATARPWSSRRPAGRKLATIKHKLLTFTDAMEIEDDGGVMATVHKAVFSPLHHRANIDLAGGAGRLEAVGNLDRQDFEIRSAAGPSRGSLEPGPGPRHLRRGRRARPGRRAMICVAVCLDRIRAEGKTPPLGLRDLRVGQRELAAQVAQHRVVRGRARPAPR